MKRKLEADQFVKKVLTYFTWNKCGKCNFDFRRENGWSWIPVEVGSRMNGYIGSEIYVCAECFPTANEALEYFIDEDRKTIARPDPPPAPPKAD